MKPGRELDKLIAEKIFKFETETVYDVWVFLRNEGKYSGGDWIPTHVPDYSTSITAAWQLVDKIRTLTGIDYDSDLFTVQQLNSGWRAGTMSFIDWTLEAVGDTAPHAICLAALKAAGVDFETT